MSKMIFYHPYNIAVNPSMGSELRPKKMKEAFQNIGYDVELVVGDSKERRIAINKVKENILDGEKYQFMYVESSNMPIPLADSHHIPLRPLQDYKFFRLLNKTGVPIGFFCRDLYWRVDELKREMAYYKYLPKQIFHWLEWYGLKKAVDYLFLPTQQMKKYLPSEWPSNRIFSLYPGCEVFKERNDSCSKKENEKLNLLYVGGVKPPYYDLKPLLSVVGKIDNIELMLCCREWEWKQEKHFYKELNLKNVTIIHANSNELIKYYQKADIFFDIREPKGYLKNTMPIKVIESIGYEVPLLLMKGTAPADFIKQEKAGWIVDTFEDAKDLLEDLRDHKEKIKDKVSVLSKINKKHTWEKRAEKASKILKKG